ncbi:MAG: nucleotidyl transferase AbiEii/AbiGii toxin family protein [Deltaproteobacteria bacterium]|nr:nucleotidyl transferase AbiEii/AbiGii toxin family protein [Deltaproteobacteria bacterium]
MHEKVLPEGSKALLAWLEINAAFFFQDWTLAGGTGLALWLGHRISEDFDFFRTEGMDPERLHDLFGRYGDYETLQEAENTLTVLISGTKLSFFQIAAPFLFESTPYRCLSVADIRDIALMKLVAISGRGSRKDFIDLHTILRSGATLQGFFDLLPKKYGPGRLNTYHILKSLTYFEDAEQEPTPTMLEPFDWEECKAFFAREAHAIVLPD